VTEDITTTLTKRGKRYGSFADNAKCAQEIKTVIQLSPNWNRLTAYHREALDMISSKLSRILTGDPDYEDNWRDIAGYALRVAEILTGEK
jgi:hypothetical protein